MHNTKALLLIVAAVVVSTAIPPALLAQWPAYPTPSVPKLPDGKPNMEGPAPRTPDGKPDLTGIWEFVDAGPRFRPKGTPAFSFKPGAPVYSQFFNIGITLPGETLPFTPWAAALRKQRKDNNNKDNPDAHCLPLGLMQLHAHPQPREIVQTPSEIVIVYEANYGLRQIFTDGRPVPKIDDVEPWWYGYSVGHWEGDTMVVETVGFRDDVWLDVEGSPLTNTGKMTERFRRPDFGHLQIDITVEDPKAYTKPWTVRIDQKLMLNTNLIEFICNENEKSDAHLVGKDN